MDKPVKIKFGNIFFKIISSCLPVKKRVFFIGSLKDKLWDTSQIIHDNLDCEKKVHLWSLPHTIKDLISLSYYIMTSKVIVVDTPNIYFAYIKLKKQQKLVYVGHGCCGPFKKMGMDRESYNPYEEFCNDQYDTFIVASDCACNYYRTAYNINEEAFAKIGYPCVDSLINDPKEYEKEFYQKYPDLINKKIILYMPTFRLTDDSNDYLCDYDYEIDWDNLDEYLDESGYVFLIKRHPVMLQNDIEIITKDYSNIIEVTDISNYALMVASDLLITDYSAVFHEYLLLDKPIIFYCPDFKKYSKLIGIYGKFPDEFPGTFCQSYGELINSINFDEDVDYSYYKERTVKYCDGNSTKNLLKIINDYLE